MIRALIFVVTSYNYTMSLCGAGLDDDYFDWTFIIIMMPAPSTHNTCMESFCVARLAKTIVSLHKQINSIHSNKPYIIYSILYAQAKSSISDINYNNILTLKNESQI